MALPVLRSSTSFVVAFVLAVVSAAAQPEPDGAALFVSAGCAGCHGERGEGGPRTPRIAGNGFTFAPGNVVYQILDGGGPMPPFAARLTDAEVAAIVNFVRAELNPYADLVTAAFVRGLRD
jgi:mono/diheme cytochrome c family protein